MAPGWPGRPGMMGSRMSRATGQGLGLVERRPPAPSTLGPVASSTNSAFCCGGEGRWPGGAAGGSVTAAWLGPQKTGHTLPGSPSSEKSHCVLDRLPAAP